MTWAPTTRVASAALSLDELDGSLASDGSESPIEALRAAQIARWQGCVLSRISQSASPGAAEAAAAATASTSSAEAGEAEPPLKMRLLQFHTDVRPAYFGTWTKKSALVAGRRPLGQDTQHFDYEYDSEAAEMLDTKTKLYQSPTRANNTDELEVRFNE